MWGGVLGSVHVELEDPVSLESRTFTGTCGEFSWRNNKEKSSTESINFFFPSITEVKVFVK